MANVIVVGGGPAGMMAAMAAAKNNKVTLLEGNERLGKKLFITGKGRCNVTNIKDISEFFDYIPGNPYFLYSALYTYTNEDTMNFFKEQGIKLKAERGGRVFPESDKSSDIIKGLTSGLKEAGVDVRLDSKVSRIIKEGSNITAVELINGKKIYGDSFIICTGGASYPLTGSDGKMFNMLEEIGHSIVELKPSLVPIEVKEDFVRDIAGLSLRNIGLTIKRNNTVEYKEQGEVKFTYYGLTGPLVLKGSRYIIDEQQYKAIIDFKPALDEAELDKRVQKDFKKYINNSYKNSLNDLLPQKIIPIIIKLSEIDENKKVNEITREERKRLVYLLKNFEMNVKGLRPLSEAIVTSGGVSINEIDPSTMKSKIINNLSFAGEVIDVDAFTGGYNVQIALSTGYIAGDNI